MGVYTQAHNDPFTQTIRVSDVVYYYPSTCILHVHVYNVDIRMRRESMTALSVLAHVMLLHLHYFATSHAMHTRRHSRCCIEHTCLRNGLQVGLKKDRCSSLYVA